MLHAADVETIQKLKKKAEEEAVKRRELEKQGSKSLSLLQDKMAAWNIVEQQLKVGRLLYRTVKLTAPEIDVHHVFEIQIHFKNFTELTMVNDISLSLRRIY